MSRRSSITDDKLISEMILRNIAMASQKNVDMADILNDQQMKIITAYKEIYNYQSYLTFFLSLGVMSHFSQGSYYTHYASPDHRPVQIYLWLLGPSGSGKTHAFRQMEKAIIKTERMFPFTYLKPVIVNGKPTESDLSSLITHTNHIGLRQHLASNNKILLNDDADLIAENYGLYNVNDYTKEHERNIILCRYDGFNNTSRTTGTTIIQIDDKRLTIAIATTGGKLMKNMKNWINCTGFDGSHNRFLYMSIPKLMYTRPQDFKVNIDSKRYPSLTHLCLITHLFGTVRYIFQMSQSERKKFCGAVFDEPSTPSNNEEQTQTQEQPSSIFTLWNLIADLIEIQDQIPNEQQQIIDFYAKAGTTFPRLACLMQLYFNAVDILERVKDHIVFAEGDNQDLTINEQFVSSVENIIKKDYYVCDKTYLPLNETDQTKSNPMVMVEKKAVIAAWRWYEHHLNIATNLFTIDHNYLCKPISTSSLISHKPKTLKQLIMLFDYNIFPISALTVKHPLTEQTGILKNRPAMGEQAIQELMKDHLLKFNYFLTDVRGRSVKSYMKVPIPSVNDPRRQQFINVLFKHDIDIDEYSSHYEKASMPLNNNLSNLTLQIFERSAALVSQYSKYRNQLNVLIQKHIDNRNIEEVSDGAFTIINSDVFNHCFHDIQNLVIVERPEQRNNKSRSVNFLSEPSSKHTTESLVQLNITAANEIDAFINPVETHNETSYHESPKRRNDESNVRMIATMSDEHESSPGIENSSVSMLEKHIDDNEARVNEDTEDECREISTQQTIKEVTNTYGTRTEQAVKKAMQNIMTGRSAIYTKTDLSHICNKSSIRLEAIKRLIAVKLLEYGKGFWVEPSRSKKNSQKNARPILREGWLKTGPESDSHASKFSFIQILQENVNITYDEYLKSFYPYQQENVFTLNNWTLSNELIGLFQENFFYTKHIRWSNARFQPSAAADDQLELEHEIEKSSTQELGMNNPTKIATSINNHIHDTLRQQSTANNHEEQATTQKVVASSYTKRKAESNEGVSGYQIRTQPRRMKKN